MTQQVQHQTRPLCPHLAAAVLWMSKSDGATKRGKTRVRDARALGRQADDWLAL
jgi:hypothetical protein